MNDTVREPEIANADVLYIGYPKAASVFLGKYFENHPEVTIDHHRIVPRLLHSNSASLRVAAKPCPDKVHVSRDEGFAESLCVIGDLSKWHRYKYVPGAWDLLKGDILVDPHEAAKRLHRSHPQAKVLMVLREQTDWLNSIYKYSVNELPAHQRSFADYCATPYGIVLLQAGHFDRTISAYIDVFGRKQLCVLRYDDLINAPTQFTARLCAFMGISEQPLPPRRENESHAQIARLLRLFPIVGRLPRGAKDAIKPRAARLLPGARGMLLSSHELRLLRSVYVLSNQHAVQLIELLS